MVWFMPCKGEKSYWEESYCNMLPEQTFIRAFMLAFNGRQNVHEFQWASPLSFQRKQTCWFVYIALRLCRFEMHGMERKSKQMPCLWSLWKLFEIDFIEPVFLIWSPVFGQQNESIDQSVDQYVQTEVRSEHSHTNLVSRSYAKR